MHWAPDPESKEWTSTQEVVHFVAKVETHNHTTAVSPYLRAPAVRFATRVLWVGDLSQKLA